MRAITERRRLALGILAGAVIVVLAAALIGAGADGDDTRAAQARQNVTRAQQSARQTELQLQGARVELARVRRELGAARRSRAVWRYRYRRAARQLRAARRAAQQP